MTSTFRLLLSAVIFVALGTLVSCKRYASPEAIAAYDVLIPKPVSAAVEGNGVFMITDETRIVSDDSKEVIAVAQYLADMISRPTGFNFTVETAPAEEEVIVLTLSGADPQLGDEGYELTVTEKQVKIVANKPAGLFYGVQTIRQLLPDRIEKKIKQGAIPWEIATGTIRDQPTYSWRGSMLDVARHFFSVEDVKRYIDLMAAYKMNVFHLHLSDDQGWRIEIKSWPNLATIGGTTQVGGGKGGYYTQEQYKEIVAYAQQRFITVIPEIDLPGHINSALASYGELNGGIIVPEEGRYKGKTSPQADLGSPNKPTELYTGIEVGWSTLRLEKPVTFQFVDDVMRELAAITPGPYLHIGGDEAHVTKKEDYIQFINRFKEIVRSHGKQMIGWEEIAQGDLDENVIAQHWNSPKYPVMAAEKGAKVLMSPSKKVYLDMQYDSTSRIGLHWAAYIEVEDSYNWDPATRVEGVDSRQVVGVEAPLWGETITNMNDIEYLLFPRLPGIAEVAWTPVAQRDWETYKERLGKHGRRMKMMEIDFYRSPQIEWAE